MSKNCNIKFYETITEKGFTPKFVVEVGVWHPDTSNIYRYIMNGVKTMLIEPDPRSIELIKTEFNQPDVVLHEAAVCDFEGEIELCQRESSTFVCNLPSSPALVNDDCDIKKSETFIAKAIKFSSVDNGKIDLISIDTEGSEWFVIKNMSSRPVVISVETHGGMYINPYIQEIRQWMQNNNYSLLYKDKSDSIYVLKNKIKITTFEKLNLIKQNLFISLKAVRKKISKKLKS